MSFIFSFLNSVADIANMVSATVKTYTHTKNNKTDIYISA